MSANEPMPGDPLKADPAPEGGADKPRHQGEQAPHPMAAAGVADPIVVRPEATETDSSYKVGKGRPPLHSRFKPGQSGNPKGRRKGSKNEATLLTEILDGEKVTLRVNGKTRKIAVREGIYRTATQDALKGDDKARRFVIERETAVKAGEAGPGELSAEEKEIIDDYLKRLVAERTKSKS
jgi:hypothetical protein